MRAEALGRASNALGAGRSKVDDPVDHARRVVVLAEARRRVTDGEPLVEMHHRDGRGLEAAVALVPRRRRDR